jgi:hypothetical protein
MYEEVYSHTAARVRYPPFLWSPKTHHRFHNNVCSVPSKFLHTMIQGGRDSSVDIETGYGLEGPGIKKKNPGGGEIIPNVQTDLEAHPASCAMGTGSSPGVKRPGRGADHPSPSSAEVKRGLELYLYPLWAFGSVMGHKN